METKLSLLIVLSIVLGGAVLTSNMIASLRYRIILRKLNEIQDRLDERGKGES